MVPYSGSLRIIDKDIVLHYNIAFWQWKTVVEVIFEKVAKLGKPERIICHETSTN